MPLLWIVRLCLALVSWAIPIATVYLLSTWYHGDLLLSPDGLPVRVRDDWRLWVALALVAWSFIGGFVMKWLLARPDSEPLNAARSGGVEIEGAHRARLYVESVGSERAPCLVLTHGWGLDSTIWAYAKRHLSSSFRVVTWDLPGMGLSKAGRKPVSLEDFAANLARVISWTQADRVVLVGHSIGGMTTQTLARDHPQFTTSQVAGVVLLNTTWHNPLTATLASPVMLALRFPLIEPMMFVTRLLFPLAWLSAWQSFLNGTAHLANRIAFASQVTHSQLDHTTLLSTRNHPGVQAEGNLAMFRWDAKAAFSGLGVPVLVLAGKQDILTKPEAGQQIAHDTPEAAIEIIDDANHMGFLERHHVYNQAIAAFATSVLNVPPRLRVPLV